MDASPFDRDTDKGAEKIVLREGKVMTSAEIARHYGFSLSFVKEVLGGDNQRPGHPKAEDVQPVPVGDGMTYDVSYSLNGPIVKSIPVAAVQAYAKRKKLTMHSFMDTLLTLREFTGDRHIKDWEMN